MNFGDKRQDVIGVIAVSGGVPGGTPVRVLSNLIDASTGYPLVVPETDGGREAGRIGAESGRRIRAAFGTTDTCERTPGKPGEPFAIHP